MFDDVYDRYLSDSLGNGLLCGCLQNLWYEYAWLSAKNYMSIVVCFMTKKIQESWQGW
jgi:hypothetical protein